MSRPGWTSSDGTAPLARRAGAGRTRFQLTLTPAAEIVASGGRLGLENAAKLVADTFVARFPRKRFWLKKVHTSGMGKWPAMISAPRRLSVASERSWEKGAWEPVRMTGLERLDSRKDRAEAVYERESVPWRITKASKRL